MGRFFKWFGLPGNLVLSCLISIYAVVMACLFRDVRHILCAAAMLLSTLGDIFMMDFKPITKLFPLRGFTAGALTFGLAHLVYAAAYLTVIITGGYVFINAGAVCGFAVFALSLAALVAMKVKNKSGKILVPICYLVLIAFNLTVIFSCSASRMPFGITAMAGAASFFVSDLFIALDVVGGFDTRVTRKLIWWFYPIGQILIITGI